MLLVARCPIDGFGVGTQLVVVQEPALDMAHKLVAYDGSGRTKFSSGKVIYPGRKQVFRKLEHGVFLRRHAHEHGENSSWGPVGAHHEQRPTRRAHATHIGRRADWACQQIDALPAELRSLEDTGYCIRWRSATGSWANSPGCGTPTRPKPTPGSNVVGAKGPNDPRTTSRL